MRCTLSFALIRSSVMAIRGSQSASNRNPKIEQGYSEGRLGVFENHILANGTRARSARGSQNCPFLSIIFIYVQYSYIMRFLVRHNRHHKVSQSVPLFKSRKTVTIFLRIKVGGHFVMSIVKCHESHYVGVLDNPHHFPFHRKRCILSANDVVVDLPCQKDATKVFLRDVNTNKYIMNTVLTSSYTRFENIILNLS